MADEQLDNPGVRIPPPLLYVLPLLAGLGLRTVLPGIPLPRLLRRVLGVLLVGGGGGLMAWFVGNMRQAETPINPAKPVTALVTEGPFEVSRNPAYLGMATMYAGLALLVNALSSLIALPVVLLVVTKVVIEREEPYLERRFGDEYRDYRARVRRWL
jgi:protein-S-isoprenylcysteine O-methyltransferase Ste14